MTTLGKLIDLTRFSAVAMVAGGLASAVLADDSKLEQGFNSAGRETDVAAGLVTGSRTDLILQALEDNDFEGELKDDTEGDPLIESTDKDEPFSIHFYRCTDHTDCQAIQFVSGWNLNDGISLAKIEEWNNKKVWGQAYRDENKDPWVALSVNLKGGVTVENLDDTVDGWRHILRDFEEHIGWNSK